MFARCWVWVQGPVWQTVRDLVLSRALLALVAVTHALGCGGSQSEAQFAPSQGPAPAVAPEAPMERGSAGRGYGYSYEASDSDQSVKAQLGAPYSVGLDMSSAYPTQVPGTKGKGFEPDEQAPAPPVVVYSGYLQLQVRRLLETLDAIAQACEARGGYVEALSRRSIVVRVPAQDFEQVMVQLAEFGEVLERRITAADVSEEFTDLGARLAVAQEARQRLLALLAQTKNTDERLKIVAEVKRLTEQIEAMESRLATLQNLVDFYTVSIDLVPLVADSKTPTFQSPFNWVSNLSALRTTLTEGLGDFSWQLPSGFVQFDKDELFWAQAADTAQLRAARLDNEPLADTAYWAQAIEHEMLARGEKRQQSGTSGVVQFQVYANDEDKPRYYLLGVNAREDDVFVLEGFFPNKASYERHGSLVIQSLKTFKPE